MAAVAPPTREAEPGPLLLILVLQPQAKLNGTRLVTLCVNRSEAASAEIAVRITEIRAVENIAQLSLEPQIESLLDRKDLEDVDVLVVGGERADRSVSPGCVSEQGIGSGGIRRRI